ncbi:MAG: hypothetical protein KGL42_12975 [Betaproteobacteria bacterium]|nr:hypothetical protein [Betaproteobacteria bacterium]
MVKPKACARAWMANVFRVSKNRIGFKKASRRGFAKRVGHVHALPALINMILARSLVLDLHIQNGFKGEKI